jgi:hypothetical protein
MTTLFATVRWGKNTGIQVEPHRYANGKYRLAWNYEKRKQYIETDFVGIEPLLRRGMRLWMSNGREKHPPGLVLPKSIHGWKPRS